MRGALMGTPTSSGQGAPAPSRLARPAASLRMALPVSAAKPWPLRTKSRMAGTLDTSQTTSSLTCESAACASISLRKICPRWGMMSGNAASWAKGTLPPQPCSCAAGPIRHKSSCSTGAISISGCGSGV